MDKNTRAMLQALLNALGSRNTTTEDAAYDDSLEEQPDDDIVRVTTRNVHKNKDSLANFIELAKKYGITTNGSRKQIAERLSSSRGVYLSKTEKNLILPYLSDSVNKRIYVLIIYAYLIVLISVYY